MYMYARYTVLVALKQCTLLNPNNVNFSIDVAMEVL